MTLACGLPPMASDVAPFRALVGDLAEGRFAPPDDALVFAEGLASLAQQLGDQSRISVRRHFAAHLAFPAIGRRLPSICETTLARSLDR